MDFNNSSLEYLIGDKTVNSNILSLNNKSVERLTLGNGWFLEMYGESDSSKRKALLYNNSLSNNDDSFKKIFKPFSDRLEARGEYFNSLAKDFNEYFNKGESIKLETLDSVLNFDSSKELEGVFKELMSDKLVNSNLNLATGLVAILWPLTSIGLGGFLTSAGLPTALSFVFGAFVSTFLTLMGYTAGIASIGESKDTMSFYTHELDMNYVFDNYIDISKKLNENKIQLESLESRYNSKEDISVVDSQYISNRICEIKNDINWFENEVNLVNEKNGSDLITALYNAPKRFYVEFSKRSKQEILDLTNELVYGIKPILDVKPANEDNSIITRSNIKRPKNNPFTIPEVPLEFQLSNVPEFDENVKSDESKIKTRIKVPE